MLNNKNSRRAFWCVTLMACSEPVSPSPSEPPLPPIRSVGTPSCSFGDLLSPNKIYITVPKNSTHFSFLCESTFVHAIMRNINQWLYLRSENDSQYILGEDRLTRKFNVTIGASPIVEFDLESVPPARIFRDTHGFETQRSSLPIPTVRWVPIKSKWTFEDICFDRTTIPILEGVQNIDFEFLSFLHNQTGMLIRTCGYVDFIHMASNGATTRTNISEIDKTQTLRVLWPHDAWMDSNANHSQVLIATLHKGSSTPSTNTHLQFTTITLNAPTMIQSKVLSFQNNIYPLTLRLCENNALIAGYQNRPIVAGNNDTEESDLWLAKIDLSTMTIVRELSLNIDNDDFAFVAACDSASGEIYIGGTTSRHFVDTGSWIGGGKALLLRFDSSLELQEKLIFGNERLAIVQQIAVGLNNLVLSGTWDATPNNHLPDTEQWSRSFLAVVPRARWLSEALEVRSLKSLSEIQRGLTQ